ncbi:MAG: rod shape-determining protein RodA [Synergistetes bacterium]|nr:rod shape-determining protein RodA [Synergistota bacterium]
MPKIELKSWIKGLDPYLLFILFLLITLGLTTLYSATLYKGNISGRHLYFAKQVVWVTIATVSMFIISLVDYHIWDKLSFLLYITSVILLLIVMIKGHISLGARRWINVGPFLVQPSEFLKVSMVIFLSHFLSKYGRKMRAIKIVALSLIIVGIPFLLVVKQPDLGTAMLIAFISVGILFVSGIPIRYFIYGFISVAILSPFVWHKLADYQKKRILSFLYQSDPLGASYNLIQAKISVGSGRLFGKGFFRGTQHELRFLPMGHTDFIFCVLAEELGFIGSMILVILYTLLFFRMATIATYTLDMFGKYLVVGFMVMLFSQVLINIGMSIGIMPITGVPLPFVSYGGSSILSNMAAVGVILNVYRQNKVS